VAQGTLAQNYYTAPQKMSNSSAGTTGVILGAATGLIGGMVGAAVVGGMQHSYETSNATQFAQIKQNAAAMDSGNALQAALQRELETIPHFRGKVKPNASAHFSMELKSFALQRMPGKSPDHAPAMMVHITEKAANGDELFDKNFLASGTDLNGQSVHASISEYAAKPELLRTHMQAVAAHIALQCGAVLREKLED
jgi:hypothetical protein